MPYPNALQGKVAVVTGANRGLGQSIAARYLAAGAEVFFACRRESAAYAALGEIQASGVPTEGAHIVRLDLASLSSVAQAAKEINRRVSAIDLLVLNAGVFRLPPTLSGHGVEMHFAVNYLGHFVLSALLWPAVLRSAAARILGVTSRTEPFVPRRFRDPRSLAGQGPWKSYAFSKRCLLSFILELDRRMNRADLEHRAIAVDPGFVGTSLFDSGGPDSPGGRIRSRIMQFGGSWLGQTPEQGSRGLWRASTWPLAGSTGLLLPRGLFSLWGEPDWVAPSKAAQDGDFVRILWEFSERYQPFPSIPSA